MLAVLVVAAAGVVGVAGLRWLRIAQREHYLPGTVARFAWRWWTLDAVNVATVVTALVSVVLLQVDRLTLWAGTGGLLAVLLAPFGLRLRGTTSPLAWTWRLKRVAVVSALLWLLGAAGAWLLRSGALLVLSTLLLPLFVDLALLILEPIERRLGNRWVDAAAKKLASIAPVVVAITGSYGKTTTKEYARLILGASRPTVASPASFNNRMGLARTINEHLAPGTEVFIAEMGTYGPGEIADLCSWIPPTVGVMTAIGPVHLERFGSLDRTLAAKAEILERAEVAVLNVDDPRLADLALRTPTPRVVTCSATGRDARVSLTPTEEGFQVRVDGSVIGSVGALPLGSNLACAVGIAVALDAPLDRLAASLADASTPRHRQTVFVGEGGFTIVDDTYNSNPAGVEAALEKLVALGDGRRVVVTPGMVELGDRQAEENRRFGSLAAQSATDVVVVGRTNRKALLEGTREGSASVIVMRSRQEAVAWVRANLEAGDVVLYENDLPDHYA